MSSTERGVVRRAKHKLAALRQVDEVSGSVAATCRYDGITRTCFNKWRRRYDEEGFEGLKDRSSVPHHSPNATSVEVVEVVEKILWLSRVKSLAGLLRFQWWGWSGRPALGGPSRAGSRRSFREVGRGCSRRGRRRSGRPGPGRRRFRGATATRTSSTRSRAHASRSGRAYAPVCGRVAARDGRR